MTAGPENSIALHAFMKLIVNFINIIGNKAANIVRIGIDAIQIHGAVGYTWEHDPQLYLKRSKWSRAMYGDANHHYDRIASLGGL